jgi:hypothetical protein
MNTVSSRDGTTIAYDKVGERPALILVDGALSVHSPAANGMVPVVSGAATGRA